VISWQRLADSNCQRTGLARIVQPFGIRSAMTSTSRNWSRCMGIPRKAGRKLATLREVVGAVPTVRIGAPNPDLICTSHSERQNLSMRMTIRRLTRLTNAHSKKRANHYAALALYFAFYNF